MLNEVWDLLRFVVVELCLKEMFASQAIAVSRCRVMCPICISPTEDSAEQILLTLGLAVSLAASLAGAAHTFFQYAKPPSEQNMSNSTADTQQLPALSDLMQMAEEVLRGRMQRTRFLLNRDRDAAARDRRAQLRGQNTVPV